MSLNNLDLLKPFGRETALTSNDDVTKSPNWLYGEQPDASGIISNATPCAVIILEKTPRDVDVFYFYFYSYDRGANVTQVLPPFNAIFTLNETEQKIHYGDHIGDWENNMIRFRDGLPTGIYYSQHSDGRAFNWDSEALHKELERPIVYSAYGSHANYATNGSFIHDSVLVDYCDAGLRWDPIKSAYFYRLDPETFTVERLFTQTETKDASNLTSWFYYEGIWGDLQYPKSDPRQRIIPHFGLRRFESGPTGPRAKQLIRNGLYPNHRHEAGWIEWVVKLTMAWYPCCLRGWKKWVFVTFLVTLLVALVVVIKRSVPLIVRITQWGIQKLGRRGYQKVVDVDLDDLGHSREDPRVV